MTVKEDQQETCKSIIRRTHSIRRAMDHLEFSNYKIATRILQVLNDIDENVKLVTKLFGSEDKCHK